MEVIWLNWEEGWRGRGTKMDRVGGERERERPEGGGEAGERRT